MGENRDDKNLVPRRDGVGIMHQRAQMQQKGNSGSRVSQQRKMALRSSEAQMVSRSDLIYKQETADNHDELVLRGAQRDKRQDAHYVNNSPQPTFNQNVHMNSRPILPVD